MSNIGVTLVVARATSAPTFGAFALVYTSYLLGLGISAAISSEPLVMRYSAAGVIELRRAIGSSTAVAFLTGLVAAIVTLVVSIFLGGPVGSAFMALALVFPGLLLQDSWRFAFFAQGRPRQAAINDFIWCGGQALALGITVLAQGEPSIFVLTLAWGAGAWLAALAGMVQARVVPALTRPYHWLRDHADLMPKLLIDFVAMTAVLQVTLYVVALVAGLADVAGLRASQTLLGPLNVVLMASRVFALPEGVRMRHASYGRLLSIARSLAVVLMTVASVWGLATCLLPASVGHSLLGDTWGPARSVLPLMVLLTVARAATVPAVVGLRVLDSPNRILAARALSSPLLFAGGVLGAIAGGAFGAATGLVVTQWVGAWLWWRQFGEAYQDGPPPSTSAPFKGAPLPSVD